jgi:hypothetical protein
MTPAIAAGVSDRLWTLEELVEQRAYETRVYRSSDSIALDGLLHTPTASNVRSEKRWHSELCKAQLAWVGLGRLFDQLRR